MNTGGTVNEKIKSNRIMLVVRYCCGMLYGLRRPRCRRQSNRGRATTPQTQETVTDYEYKYNFWTGDFVLVPNIHTETVPEKYEVLYFVTYDNGDTSHCWEAVNKAEYDAAVAFLETQTKGGGQ